MGWACFVLSLSVRRRRPLSLDAWPSCGAQRQPSLPLSAHQVQAQEVSPRMQKVVPRRQSRCVEGKEGGEAHPHPAFTVASKNPITPASCVPAGVRGGAGMCMTDRSG